ncbi:MAG: MFS transporter [Chamaesiphon sp.]
MVAYSSPLSTASVDYLPVQTLSPPPIEDTENNIISETAFSVKSPSKLNKLTIRSSLKASTWDGVFATIFSSITGGVLLSNFLLQLGANPMEIGMLSSVPMLVNLLQPIGAYLSERTTSRHWYGIWIFGPSRLLWLILVLAIALNSWHHTNSHQLIGLTLTMVLVTHVLGSLGGASWLSWMAALVPERLRGRYFGVRNSATSLTNLIGVPLLGLAVTDWPGGTIQGYGVVLLLGVVIGIISLSCQFFIVDVNPKEQGNVGLQATEAIDDKASSSSFSSLAACLSPNFLKFLLYFSFWTFAVNVSSPFFNLYLLDNLAIDVSWVTLYGSLTAAASLLMLVFWGKLADRIGNRPLLLFVGVLVAMTPLLWLGIGANAISLWVWFPLLHLLMGGTWAAIDLCSNNLQMAVAPGHHQATYFAIAAAVSGVFGALGATTGGFLAQFADYGGLPGLFAFSATLRLVALLPLVFVQEHRSQPLGQVMRILLPFGPRLVTVPAAELVNRAE